MRHSISSGGLTGKNRRRRTNPGATAAQAAIAWLLDHEGVIAVPEAGRPESQKANLEALTISLDDEDRAVIAALPKSQRFVGPSFAAGWDAVV